MIMIRRDLFKKAGAVAAGMAIAKTGLAGPLAGETRGLTGGPGKKPLLRVAHITDIHLPGAKPAVEAHVSGLLKEIGNSRVDFFLNGGDSIFDASYDNVSKEKMLAQWDAWDRVTQAAGKTEMFSCIGNHDCWWAAPDKTDAMYGKDYVVKRLKIPGRYYSVDRKGWHFIVLDGNNEKTTLDREQYEWLEADLAALKTGTPTLLMSHFPMFGATPMLVGGNHSDNGKLKSLFYKHRDKVRIMLSGHNHLYDRTTYNNVQYCCNGSVSGYWWGDGDKDSAATGYYYETSPGYAMLDLYADGTVENTYIEYPFSSFGKKD